MADTLVTSEVEFDEPDEQTGLLHVPHSRERWAYGWIPVPTAVLANGRGPTVLLMAGTHGDEYEGQIAFTGRVRELEPGSIRGCIVVLTMASSPAAASPGRLPKSGAAKP
ncbi:MAG TPA: hypothetical protein ENJ83_01295 [Rhodospirillales bacterium]|nr:hypothetical protein [Rhodospirillales bacterium]